MPADEIAGMVPPPGTDSPVARMGSVDVEMEDGDYPMGPGTPLRVVWTPGHTPGHVCFAHEDHDVLLTGDHLLPRISPNISPAPANTDDTLGAYLASLELVGRMDAEEILPAHEYRFSGLATRVRQLQQHHAARLAEIQAAVVAAPGRNTLQIAEVLTWSRPWDQSRGIVRRSAIGETYAHLLHLACGSQVTDTGTQVDSWHPATPSLI